MNEYKRILDLLKKYVCSLGYQADSVDGFLTDITEIVVMKLADSNVVPKNKKGKSHQTHIAITGKTISFFYDTDEFEKKDCESIDIISVDLIERNIERLLSKVDIEKKAEDISYIHTTVSIGKRTQNQIQLSKSISDNGKDFNSLRDSLYPEDLLVLIKTNSQKKIVCLGIDNEFYSSVIPEYDTFLNSNTYINVMNSEDNMARKASCENVFDVYTEKSTDAGTVCYFCGCTLSDYMKCIPETYRDNDIQRGIVKNVYLDRIVQTIIKNDCIPTITLVGDGISLTDEGKKLKLEKYRILDGLQRTFRINEIWKCMRFFEEINNKDELLEYSRIKLRRVLAADLREHDCDFSVFMEVLNEYRKNGSIDRFWKYYNSNIQWFEIWENLSPEEETKKMLILNAGHKQMEIRHQLELLFLNMLPELNQMCEENHCKGIIRNKDKTDMFYSKERKKGEYYFSHIISAAISYTDKKAITTNVDLVNNIQQETREDIDYVKLKEIMSFLFKLDDALEQTYGDLGTKWIGRETVLVGMFAALGEIGDDAFSRLIDKVDGLNLNLYETSKNENIEVSKVNVGNVTKAAVNNAILDLLNGKVTEINWDDYFGGDEQ